MNKKGFSLVELIVVIAIMAVLVGILAPTLIGYVEKSRKQKDESAVAEIENAFEVALNEEANYDEAVAKLGTDSSFTVTYTMNASKQLAAPTDTAITKLLASVNESITSPIAISSKEYKKKTGYVITITSSGNTLTVKGAWSDTAPAATTKP